MVGLIVLMRKKVNVDLIVKSYLHNVYRRTTIQFVKSRKNCIPAFNFFVIYILYIIES
jgi:hypothetical protein